MHGSQHEVLTLVRTQRVRHGGVPLSLLGHWQTTCFFIVVSAFRGPRRVSREALLAVARRMSGRPPAPLPLPLASPPTTQRWLRASRSTLALAQLPVHIGRAALQIAEA